MAKRAQIIYEILQAEISRMDFSKKGEERVKEFLRVIEFENVSEITRNSFLVIEEEKLYALKSIDVFYALRRAGIYYNWPQYYRQLQNDFRSWTHCDRIRKVAGKPTGTGDLFRLYTYLWNSTN